MLILKGEEMGLFEPERCAREILGQLVRIRTTQPAGDEKDAVIFLREIFEPFTKEIAVLDHGANRASMILTMPGRDRGRAVAVTGHLDTVNVDSEEAWTHAPFSAFCDGERLYGRGAADMKGGVTSIVLTALKLFREGFEPSVDVHFCFTADEEYGGIGAEALCNSGKLDCVAELVVVKPTDGRVGLAGKGALGLSVSARGLSAHASRPGQGVNAVEQVSAFARSISALLRKKGRYPLLGASTCVVTGLHGSISTNVVPDRAEATFDIRTSPGISHAGLLDQIHEMARAQMQKYPPLVLEITPYLDRPALGMDGDAPLVRRFVRIFKTLGLPWETTGITYFTDASVFVPRLGVPFVVIGPGDERFFHQADEYVTLKAVLQSARIFEEYVRTIPGAEDGEG